MVFTFFIDQNLTILFKESYFLYLFLGSDVGEKPPHPLNFYQFQEEFESWRVNI